MEQVDQQWRLSLQAALHARLDNWRQLGGGDFAQSWQVCVQESDADSSLIKGQWVFVKTHANPPPKHFTTEARGLEWLRESGSVNIPKVLAVSDEPPYLALEWVAEGARATSSESTLGVGLAGLHQASCAYFGRADERTTGSLGLPNAPSARWAEFYGSQRLLPLARIAHDRQALSYQAISRLERLAQQLEQWESADVKPSRLHGDLWAGNRLVDEGGKSWLIDPACHGGHREFDLAMMRLFGGYGESCFRAYDEHFPLSAGWHERILLHQLAPLVVHAIKFGSAYVSQVEEALSIYT